MEAWTRVIVEWINCLEIAQPFVEDIRELRNYVLYNKIVSQLCPTRFGEDTSNVKNVDDRERVSEFLRAEYPEYTTNEEYPTVLTEELYVGSLLLVQCSQKAAFHRPMCANLKPETQVRVKQFLEMVLPYGKTINRDIVGVAVMETSDADPKTPMTTPIIRPLREFFNSPAARSAQNQRLGNDRHRELRRLKAQLETERFEKLDLAEDLRIQEEKVRNLQTKLQEKIQELKTMRLERTKPPTPQSCRKTKRPSDNEERYRRESENLEIANMGLQSEIEKLQDEREDLVRRLTSKDRSQSALKEKLDQCERSAEALSIQLEMRNNELLSLRMNNEELREHIREIQRSSLGDQSFEMEPINRARSPFLMNSSEAMSSIVDIQLQEAKEETALLRTQLDSTSKRLDSVFQECEDFRRTNEILKDKASQLDAVTSSMHQTQERLVNVTKSHENLEHEKSELMANLLKLEDALASNKQQLATAQNRVDALAIELAESTSTNRDLEASLKREKLHTNELESIISRGNEERDDLRGQLTLIEDKLVHVEKDKAAVEINLREKLDTIEKLANDLTNEKSRVNDLETILSRTKKQFDDLEIVLAERDENLSRFVDENEKLQFKLQETIEKLEESHGLSKNDKIRIDELESTMTRLKNEYQDLQNNLSINEKTLSNVNDENNLLKSNLNENERLLRESESHLSDEKIVVAKLESKLTSTKKQFEDLKIELASTNQKLFDIEKIKESLEFNLKDCEKKLEISETELKSEKNLIVELKSTIKHFQTDCDNLQSKQRSIEENLAIERTKVADLESAIKQSEKYSEDLKIKLEESETLLINEKSESADLKKILSTMENNCTELETSLRSKEKLFEDSQKLVDTLNTDLESCRLKIKDLESTLHVESQRFVDLETKNSQVLENCAKLESELSSKSQILLEIQTSKKNLEDELTNKNKIMRDIELNIQNLRREFVQLEDEKTQMHLENVKLENYAKNVDEEIVKLKSEIVDHVERIKNLEETSEKDGEELSMLRDVVTEKTSTIDELTLRIGEMEYRENELSNDLEAATKKIEDLKKLGEEMESQLVEQRDRLAMIRDEKKTLEDELTSYVRSEANFKDQIVRMNEKIENLESKLREQMDSNVALDNDKSKLREALSQLENKMIQEQQRSTVIMNEKQNLERELSSIVDAKAIMKKRIVEIENELKERTTNLNNELETNEALKMQNDELEESRNKLNNELSQTRESLTIIQTEKIKLQEELSQHVKIESEMCERLTKMEKQIEESTNNAREHLNVIESLRQRINELENLKSTMETTLNEERERLDELRNEKEMLDEELSIYGRSNADLGKKIIELERQMEQRKKDLQKERDTNASLEKLKSNVDNEMKKLEKFLKEEQERVTIVENENKMLEEKLQDHEKTKADMNEELCALRKELELSGNDYQQLQEKNAKLETRLIEADSTIETLKNYEMLNETLSKDLQTKNQELNDSRMRIENLSQDLNVRTKEITILKTKLNEIERENSNSTSSLEQKILTSEEIVKTLKKRLTIVEKNLTEAEIDKKLKEENVNVVNDKLERLSREKIESELRMKEIIVNLQEVRASQDGVLQAQSKSLKEKIDRLEEAEKEIIDLRASLTSTIEKMDAEKSKNLETQTNLEKMKEHNQVQSNLVKELQKALEIEEKKLEQSSKRCEALDKSVKDIKTTSKILMKELNELWNTIGEYCPDIVESRVIVSNERSNDDSDTNELSENVKTCVKDCSIMRKAVTTLNEANEKLRSNMNEIIEVSKSLKFELNGLWDSVRQACPELAKLKDASTTLTHPEDDGLRNNPTNEISWAVKSFADDAKTIRKAVSILTEANETLKEHLDGEKTVAKNFSAQAEKRELELDSRIKNLEMERKKRDDYLSILLEKKRNLQQSLSSAMSKRDEVDERLSKLIERWSMVVKKSRLLLNPESSACDELKNLQARRLEIDEIFSDLNVRDARSLKPLLKTLCRIFVWSETKLQEIKLQESFEVEKNSNDEFLDEKNLVDTEIRKTEDTNDRLTCLNEKIDDFANLLESYETSLKSGAIKRSSTNEEKLQQQLDKFAKERKEMRDKLDAMRLRNARMEKNMDDLRNENKKLKTEAGLSVAIGESDEVEVLKKLTEKLQGEVLRLQTEIDETKMVTVDVDRDVDGRLKEVHNEYGQKLEKIKQKMKTAYNEQIAKLNEEQEKSLREKMTLLRAQMEKQCRKYTEDIAKYKAHISDLSSRYWDVGEKLLAETQEKQAALQQLDQLRGVRDKHEAIAEVNQQTSVTQSRMKTASLDRRDFVADRGTRDASSRAGYRAVEVIEEETTTYSTRRHSVKSIQAMGNAFNAEDEEGELFDSVYLTDLKEGRCVPTGGPDFDRLSELRMRNSMCRPHLKSSYAVETHFQPITLNEDDIKNGVTGDDVFNDSLSQSLLPGQKPKKKDRTQTSYKRPGPPTPSKNGGRLSLQGNELKSPTSRVLRERNVERRTTATPRGLKNLFGTSMSKRQDENSTSTPKGRRLSNIFRKQRTDRN